MSQHMSRRNLRFPMGGSRTGPQGSEGAEKIGEKSHQSHVHGPSRIITPIIMDNHGEQCDGI